MARRVIRSADLGIHLDGGGETELFKWFLACLLFGKPIQQEVARRTYREFAAAGLLTPDAILQAGWDRLVEVLDRGHYVRYDFSTASKLLEICQALKARYGSLTALLHQSRSCADLSRRLQEFRGIGPVTARIFIRDLRPLLVRFRKQAPRLSRSAARDRFPRRPPPGRVEPPDVPSAR